MSVGCTVSPRRPSSDVKARSRIWSSKISCPPSSTNDGHKSSCLIDVACRIATIGDFDSSTARVS